MTSRPHGVNVDPARVRTPVSDGEVEHSECRFAGLVRSGMKIVMVMRSLEPATDRLRGDRASALTTAAWFCARWLVIGVFLYALGRVAMQVQAVLIPILIAVLLAALFAPVVSWLTRRSWPRWAATTVVLVTGLAAVGGVLTFVAISFAQGLPALSEQLVASVQMVRTWAIQGPLGLGQQQVTGLEQQLLSWLSNNQQRLAGGAFTTALTAGSLLVGAILALFSLVFFLHHGSRIWTSLSRIAPARQQHKVVEAGGKAFQALVSYTRASALVAVADAAGIGLGLWVMGVPLAGPLTTLVFLGAFLPVLGALVAGSVAVLITLVTSGPVAALVILAIVLVVEQLEGNVLQPWLLGDAAQLHPLTVVVAVATGATVAGVVGALLAVPLVTTVRAFLTVWELNAPQETGRTDTGEERTSAAPT